MNNHQARVFNAETRLRIGLQNRVLRKLRRMGCKVKAASLDAYLTISVEPSEAFRIQRHPGGSLKRRTDEGYVVCIDVDGCRVIWMEGATT